MKKRFILLTTLFTLLTITSCTNKQNNSSNSNLGSSVPPSISEENSEVVQLNEIEVYNKTVENMRGLNYQMVCNGESRNNLTYNSLGAIEIYELFQHSNDAIYFEKISSGKGMKYLANVSFAEKAYVDQNSALRQSAERDKNKPIPWDKDSEGNLIPEYNDPTYVSSYEEIWNAFGKQGDNFTIYTINEKTVSGKNICLINDKGNYVINFDLILNEGISSESIKGLANQVQTMSRYPLTSVSQITVSLEISEDYKVVKYNTFEKYSVKAMGINAEITNTLSYKFEYFNNKEEMNMKKLTA